MNLKHFLILILLLVIFIKAPAQNAEIINTMETNYKDCISVKSDSNACHKAFLVQMDSMVNIIFNEVKLKIVDNQKSILINEQISWAKKKAAFFKKQDANFVSNLQDGTWKKDMIRISYKQKSSFILKRIKTLLKQID